MINIKIASTEFSLKMTQNRILAGLGIIGFVRGKKANVQTEKTLQSECYYFASLSRIAYSLRMRGDQRGERQEGKRD